MDAIRVVHILSVVTSTWVFSQPTPDRSQELERVSNGEPYDHEKYPYIVKLHMVTEDSDFTCSGTLIAPMYVLTAAHCTEDLQLSEYMIQVGHWNTSEGSGAIGVQEVMAHPLFEHKFPEMGYDVALLKLKKPFSHVTRFTKISGHPDEFINGKTKNCHLFGFGMTSDEGKLAVNGLTVPVTVELRTTSLPTYLVATNIIVPPHKIQGMCGGDSGGPLICDEYQYAVVSFHRHGGNKSLCTKDNYPDFYQFLYLHKPWIDKMISFGCSITSLPHKFVTILFILMLYIRYQKLHTLEFY